VIDLFDAMPWSANFLTVLSSQKEYESTPNREQKNTTVFANLIS